MNPFTHEFLVMHGLTTDNANEFCVAFNLKDYATLPGGELAVVNVFKLAHVLPEAQNMLMASMHNYQMVCRNQIGLKHLLNEVNHAVLSNSISQTFYRELSSKLEQLMDLNSMTMRITLEGQQNVAKDMQLNSGPVLVPKDKSNGQET